MTIQTLHGDCRELLETLEAESVQTIVTSPPYWRMRRYTDDPREIGQEDTITDYVAALTDVFARCWRVLRNDGTLWLNLGDGYWRNPRRGVKFQAGASTYIENRQATEGNRGPDIAPCMKEKSLIGMPWRMAFALQDAGWILRTEIVWEKPNAMPESVTDRPTRSHEYVFLFAKSPRYFYDAAAIAEPVQCNDRPARRRAIEIAHEHGLTNEHINAIRAVGITDVGKARVTQTGAGRNDPRIQALADEAKAVLKGYYREFLTTSAGDLFKRDGNKRSAPVVPGNTATHRADREDIHYNNLTRNARTVWSIPTTGLADEHYAPMPQELAERCIRAGSAAGDTVLDPFGGSGTTARAALALQRKAVLIDLGYQDMQARRTDGVQVELFV